MPEVQTVYSWCDSCQLKQYNLVRHACDNCGYTTRSIYDEIMEHIAEDDIHSTQPKETSNEAQDS